MNLFNKQLEVKTNPTLFLCGNRETPQHGTENVKPQYRTIFFTIIVITSDNLRTFRSIACSHRPLNYLTFQSVN